MLYCLQMSQTKHHRLLSDHPTLSPQVVATPELIEQTLSLIRQKYWIIRHESQFVVFYAPVMTVM